MEVRVWRRTGDSTNLVEVPIQNDEDGYPLLTIRSAGRPVLAAGKVEGVGSSDQTIAPGGTFHHIWVANDGPEELRLAVDADSTTGSAIIYLKPGEPYEADITGSVLHYSVPTGAAFYPTSFRYVIR